MMKKLGAVHRSGALLAAVLMAVMAPPPARAQSCQAAGYSAVCACSGCLYLVFCGVTFGWPPSFNFSVCTGNNPGFLITTAVPGTSGLSTTRCGVDGGCGSATVVGSCCGGARATVPDPAQYSVCIPAGTACGPGVTTTVGIR